MPRTKAPRKKKTSMQCPWAATVAKHLETCSRYIDKVTENHKLAFLATLKTEIMQQGLSINLSLMDKTIGELKANAAAWSGINDSLDVVEATFNVTKSILEKTNSVMDKSKRPVTKSASFGEDEGYLTAESSNGTAGGRKSRPKGRNVAQSTRTSRSLSVKGKTKFGSVLGKFKTPANSRVLPTSYGAITPKMAPNTPQVLLRRPKLGEMALSLHGSPLFTGSVLSETVANINIPLEDGRMFTIQPQKGLRISDVPPIHPELARQLETLRDNLNKFCAAKSKH